MSALPPHMLTRGPHRPEASPGLAIAGDLRLARGRMHEICGPSRRTLALAVAGRERGTVFWIAPDWAETRPEACGFSPWLDPGRMIHVHAEQEQDILWAGEEILREGAVPVSVLELSQPPSLTAIRRLHLAAETGARTAKRGPLGIVLTPDGGTPGIETRWRFVPRFDGDRPAWRIERLRARTAPPVAYRIGAATLLGNAPFEATPLPQEG